MFLAISKWFKQIPETSSYKMYIYMKQKLNGEASKGLFISHFRQRWSQFIIVLIIIVSVLIYLMKLCKWYWIAI